MSRRNIEPTKSSKMHSRETLVVDLFHEFSKSPVEFVTELTELGQRQIAIVDGADGSKTFSNSASNLLQRCMLHFCCSLRAQRASR
jgi:hypothetical protein